MLYISRYQYLNEIININFLCVFIEIKHILYIICHFFIFILFMVRIREAAYKSKINGQNKCSKKYIDKMTQVSSQNSTQSSRENSPSPILRDEAIQTDKHLTFSNIVKFVLATLICGLTFSQIKDFCTLNETDSCSEKIFYETQKVIADTLIELARESAQKFSENLKDNTIVSIDGAWDHRRHGSSCIVTMIDIETRKIIDFAIVTNPKQFVFGTTNEAARNLEKIGVKEISERWKHSQKVKFYVHDNDGVSRKIIEQSGWKITEVLDPSHAIKSIKNNLYNYNQREGKPFKGYVESISRYIEILFRNDSISKQQRVDFYNKIPNHYLDNHSKCQHHQNIKTKTFSGDKEKFKTKLEDFLKKNIHYAEKLILKYTLRIMSVLII